MGLIDVLHSEHMEIRTHLKKIEINDDVEVINYHFKELKTVLISHLINEDNYLYPVLRNLEETKDISDSFEEEMGLISSEIMDFYSKYKDEFSGINFYEDARGIMNKLIYRIVKEERELYPTYRKFFKE